jgi:hypothetical protein
MDTEPDYPQITQMPQIHGSRFTEYGPRCRVTTEYG